MIMTVFRDAYSWLCGSRTSSTCVLWYVIQQSPSLLERHKIRVRTENTYLYVNMCYMTGWTCSNCATGDSSVVLYENGH